MHKKSRVQALVALLAVWGLAGCASGPVGDAVPAARTSPPIEAAERADPTPPQIGNALPFPNLTLTGVDKFGEYTSLALKITYTIESNGTLRPVAAGQEPFINASTPHGDDYDCRVHGGGFNQRTTWFADTGLFVRGGSLTALTQREGAARPLLALTRGDRGIMAVTGPQARESEYGYVPCVGEHRVDTGSRTLGYVTPGDRLALRPSARGGKPFTVVMPDHPRPYVVLSYAGRKARAFVPANIALLTVDVPRRRVVAQYQVTVAMTPQVAQAAWMAVLAPQTPALRSAEGKAYNDAVERYLATCEAPGKPMDPCANPHGNLPPVLRP